MNTVPVIGIVFVVIYMVLDIVSFILAEKTKLNIARLIIILLLCGGVIYCLAYQIK